jgi:hypothetical protein
MGGGCRIASPKTFVIYIKPCYEIDGVNPEKDYGKDIAP